MPRRAATRATRRRSTSTSRRASPSITRANISGVGERRDLRRRHEHGLLRLPRHRPAGRARARAQCRRSRRRRQQRVRRLPRQHRRSRGELVRDEQGRRARDRRAATGAAWHATQRHRTDGPDAVASPHKQITADNPLPKGKVWADPFDEWKAAFEATTGGGHNVLVGRRRLARRARARASRSSRSSSAGPAYPWKLPPTAARRRG